MIYCKYGVLYIQRHSFSYIYPILCSYANNYQLQNKISLYLLVNWSYPFKEEIRKKISLAFNRCLLIVYSCCPWINSIRVAVQHLFYFEIFLVKNCKSVNQSSKSKSTLILRRGLVITRKKIQCLSFINNILQTDQCYEL